MGGKRDISFWALLAIAGLGLIWLILLSLAVKPTASLKLQPNIPTISGESEPLVFAWPEQGTAAIAMDGKVKAGLNGAEARPIASLTKVITALVVLNAKPLGPDETGPNLTMTEADVARFEKARAEGQSVLEVKVGQNISQRQMLEGVMLASANNLAETLALWSYDGSVESFLQSVNRWLSENGFAATHLVDASGISPENVSSANDLVGIAAKANENAVLKSIFSARTAQFPGVGEIKNGNSLLGVDGVYGLKTGHTPEAGANLLFISKFAVKGEDKVVVGVVLGQNDSDLFEVARSLNLSAQQNVGETVVLPTGSAVGEIVSPWGQSTRVVLSAPLTTVGWKDQVKNVAIDIALEEVISTVSANKVVGTAKTSTSQVSIITENAIFEPSFNWKVTHPF